MVSQFRFELKQFTFFVNQFTRKLNRFTFFLNVNRQQPWHHQYFAMKNAIFGPDRAESVT